jgi:hypothetical protein
MKNIMLISSILALSACEIKTSGIPETQIQAPPQAQIQEPPQAETRCNIPRELVFDPRLSQDLNGNRILFFQNWGNYTEQEISEIVATFDPEAIAFPSEDLDGLTCFKDGQGPYGCTGSAFILSFPTQQQIDDFGTRCLDTENEDQLPL